MGSVLFKGGGGGGAYSSDLTTTAGDVLKGKSYVGSDTNDDIGTGTLELTGNASEGHVLTGKTFYNTNAKSKVTGSMKNVGALDSTSKVRINGNNLVLGMTNGAHITNNSNTNIAVPEVQTPFANVRSTLGISEANIKNGVTIAGVTGTYKGQGNATADQVLRGATFSTSTLASASGNIYDRGTWQNATGIGGGQSAGYVALNQIPQGYYHRTDQTSNGWWQPEVRIDESKFRQWAINEYGITANKIAKGVTLMGVTGTYNGGIVGSKSIYVNGVFGTGYSISNFAVDPLESGYGNGSVTPGDNYIGFKTATWMYDKANSHGPWYGTARLTKSIELTGVNTITIQASGAQYWSSRYPIQIWIGSTIGGNNIASATFTSSSDLGNLKNYTINLGSSYGGTGYLTFVFNTSYSNGSSSSEGYGYWSAECWIHQIFIT